MNRRWSAAAASVALLAAALSAVGLAGGGGRASANPSGASPQIFVGGPGSSGNGPYQQLTLGSLLAGGPPGPGGTMGAPVSALAVNSTATDVVYGLGSVPGTAGGQVAVENVATRAVSKAPLKAAAVGVAPDPTDASRAYVLESTQIDTVGLASSPPSVSLLTAAIGRAGTPTAIAVSPDGSHLFVGGSNANSNTPELLSVPVANPNQVTLWTFTGHPGSVIDLAVSPNGATLYGISSGTSAAGGQISELFALALPISAGEATAWPPRVLSYVPTSLTVSPDESTLYVTGRGGIQLPSVVQSFSAAAGSPGATAQVPLTEGDGTGGAVGEAVTPDGSTLAVAGTDGSSGDTWVYSLALPSLTLGQGVDVGGTFGTLPGPEDLAVTPDQAPVAAFSALPAAAGSPTSLDASASSVAYGSVTTFAWNFGDGHVATSGTAQESHVYSAPGSYTVTLTETDSAGTSVPPAVFLTGFPVDGPGQTPFRRTDNSARTSRLVVVGAPTSTPTTAAPVPGAPTLVLNPGLGPPGTLVTVTGSNFPANTPITVAWSVSSGSVVITSDAHGNLPATILPVLVPDVLGPRFAVAASSPPAQAPFLVVPGSAEPGGDQGSYLFRTEGP